jgi:hypothetical protein
MANILVQRNDLRGALAHLIDAVLLDDRDLLVWRTIGETATAMGDNHLARLAFETVVTQQPSDTTALRNLVSANEALGDGRASFDASQHVSALEPHNLSQRRVTQNLYNKLSGSHIHSHPQHVSIAAAYKHYDLARVLVTTSKKWHIRSLVSVVACKCMGLNCPFN